jgi:hypothetical protein
MVAILPDGFRHNERRVFGDGLKDVHSVTLRIEKSVLLLGHVGVSTNNLSAKTFYGLRQGLFHCRLRGPTDLVGVDAEIATGYQVNNLFVCHFGIRLPFYRFDGVIIRGNNSLCPQAVDIENAKTQICHGTAVLCTDQWALKESLNRRLKFDIPACIA